MCSRWWFGSVLKHTETCLQLSGEISLSLNSVTNEENKIINFGFVFFNEAEMMIVFAAIIEKSNSTQSFYKLKPSAWRLIHNRN